MFFRFAHTVLATATAVSLLSTTLAQRVCNNAADLCDRKYNNVVHLGAHDSPFVRNASNGDSIAGDQFYNSPTQLDAGVRLMSAQVHNSEGDTGEEAWRLCHTLCELYDAGSLANWLRSVKTWLDQHPNDVVTILLVNSDGADAATLGRQFDAAGISHYGYVPPERTQPTTDWPTLDNLISTNKRLVTFVASLDPTTNTAAPYLLDEFTFIFENNYDNINPQDFSCSANRPSQLNGQTQQAVQSGRMPFMNHFLYDELAPGIEISSPTKAANVNAPAVKPGNLGDVANTCAKEYGRNPTFLFVDFFNLGPAIAAVDRLNGVTGQTSGRTGPGVGSTSAQGPGSQISSAAQGVGSTAASMAGDVGTGMSQGATRVESAMNGMATGVDDFISKAQSIAGRPTSTGTPEEGSAGKRIPAGSFVILMAILAGAFAI